MTTPANHTAIGSASGTVTVMRVAAICSAAAGLIHYSVIPEHLSEWWLYALFFTLLGLFELGWAALAWTGAERSLLLLGLVVNVLVLALWSVTRTTGLPFGPDAGMPEAVGMPDMLCCVAEATTVVAVFLALRRGGPARRIPAAVPQPR